jgi:hypothetical protein
MTDGQHPRNGRVVTPRDAWAIYGFAPLPGDAVSLPGAERAIVETVYLCSETSDDDVTRWSWIVLADGRLIEIAPRGCAVYEAPRLLARGTGRFLELTAQDGALVRFEERVRAGTWEIRPVRLTLGGRRWRLNSTGTVTAQRLGPVPSSGWGQLGARPSTGEPDVYFTFAAETDADTLGLGLWATDVILAFGRHLGATPNASGLSTAEAPAPPDLS